MTQQTADMLPARGIPISWKLLAATVVVGVAAAGIAIIGLQRMNTLNERLTKTVDYSSENVKLAAILKQDLVSVTRGEKNLILARSDEEMARYAKTIDETLAAMHQRLEHLRKLVSEEDRRQLDRFAREWHEWQKNHHDVRNFAQLNSNVRARHLALGNGRESFLQLEQLLRDFTENTGNHEDTEADGNRPAAQARKISVVSRLWSNLAKIQRAEKQVILASSEEEVEEFEKAFEPLQQAIDSNFRELREMADQEEQTRLRQAEAAFDAYEQTLSEIRAFVGQKGNFFLQQIVEELGDPLAAKCELLLSQIVAKNEEDMQAYRDASQNTYLVARNTLLGFSAIGILISVAVSFYTGQRIARNLSRLADYAKDVEVTGDLSRPVPRTSRDEVGMLAESFEHMRETLHLQTSELAALNKALEQKHVEMEQFVYTISHDLRSPLVSCKGLVGLIKEDVADRNYQEVVTSAEKLDKAVDQLNQIIDDLLTLSRIGRKPLDITIVDVHRLVNDLTEELRGRLDEVGAEIRIDGTLPQVTADPVDLKRVFENLLLNAVKYGCDLPHPTITIGGQATGSEVRYFVRDIGRGIDHAYHEKIFGLFQRLDVEKPGTGLGLASVAKIMHMHEGRTWVESSPGEGATFWVAFPNKKNRQMTSTKLPTNHKSQVSNFKFQI